jgi:hypothetical protein
MNTIVRTALIAGAAAATAWLIKRSLDRRAHFEHVHTKHALDNWENEGGNVVQPQGGSNMHRGSNIGADLTRAASDTDVARAASQHFHYEMQ